MRVMPEVEVPFQTLGALGTEQPDRPGTARVQQLGIRG